MMSNPDESILKVRRSALVKAGPARMWTAFETFERMNAWWGLVIGTPEAGKSEGQYLDAYEPRAGGRIEMAVYWDGARVSYGGEIVTFAPAREFTFESDWIPNRGWKKPTYITLRLAPALGGTLVELFHHGFERTGPDAGAELEGYEQGWGMTQLSALKRLVESEAPA
jgi:uncharacterized protein YndB with AHSA1/START domain